MTNTTVDTPLAALLTNKRRVSALKALGVLTVADALTYYPFRVTDPVPVRALAEARFGEKMACAVDVRALRVTPMNARRGYRLEVLVDDAPTVASRAVPPRTAALVFFSHRKSYVDWMASRLRAGLQLVISGDPSTFNDRLQFTHPDILTVAPAEPPAAEPQLAFGEPAVQPQPRLRYDVDSVAQGLARATRPRPVYHANSRISSEHIHETIDQVLRLLAGEDPFAAATPGGVDSAQFGEQFALGEAARARLAEQIPDVLPEPVRTAKHLMHRAQAFCAIHKPQSVADFKRAIETMRYEEAFVCQCALLMARGRAATSNAYACADVQLRDGYIAELPFALTNGQREVIDAIGTDMGRAHPMQRLLQGEVGSGKTVVAVAAMLQAVGSGHQAVLVAPTQVLAEQHFHSISESVGGRVPVHLLTGGMKLAARRKVLAVAASGEPCIVVATHAAFSKSFQAPNLALAVIDEQHRFGVEQREALRAKSERDPHLLVMTATPIPRTAAMTWFGDLDISWLTELPGGRKPIRTFVIPEADAHMMADMFWHIRRRIDEGERAYIICPRIEPSDAEDEGGGEADAPELLSDAALGESTQPRAPLHAVVEIAQRLQSLPQFNGVRLCTLTGRDDDATKARIMADFESGETPVMVATTVVEVGVDVPQASCITIFDADRYGLSQLHQLRGRVGRGGTDSWAFLVSRAELGTVAQERLEVIAGSLDGAEIASRDLELRGAGDVLGDAQSGGKSSLKLLRVVQDARMIADARASAQELLAHDPDLAGHVQLAGAVLDFTRGNEQYLTSN
ncbi:ATP-dependent DNA helicase RecG [Bifidobacterium pseudolongum subsp. globosum]|uniref:ATP-dependent DNA helicase RecG n=1 Tax=Bifidobacterium pseudolongum TaxID=1694 RepID=UPI001F53155F|nr:ATP-dependent DNA helicase RecG [Bifidobacterium pseudolongum]MCI1195037.1 ATP-dependent DNA helicase RecG [Bifidobacterium pseudolongum subsp. globosum]UNP93257.1 ATP-dependent DNA helicase RecG [Bifidobacterium pseudolongum subsp. globosum]UNZ09864.1 ATP-dependent DNA helicase RecG [Bifidobacterium pseudolongum subsp. globosum]